MEKCIRKRVNLQNMKCFLFLLFVTIVCFGVTDFAVVDLIKGPQEINYISEKQNDNSYVKMNIKYPIEIFAKESYESQSGKEIITRIGYVVINDQYEHFGVIVDNDLEPEMTQQVQNAWKYISGESNDDVASGVKVQGYMRKMYSDELEYYNQTLEYLGLDTVTEAYCIEDGYIKSSEKSEVKGFSITGAVFGILALVVLYRIFSGTYRKGINHFLQTHFDFTKSDLETEFRNAKAIAGRVWIADRLIFIADASGCTIWKWEEVVWAYKYQKRVNLIPVMSGVKISSKYKKTIMVTANKRISNMIIANIAMKAEHVLMEYSYALSKMYSSDMNSFLNIKYNKVMAEKKIKEATGIDNNRVESMFQNNFENF